MQTPFNIYIETFPASANINYKIEINGQPFEYEIINQFVDENTQGNIVEVYGNIDIADPSQNNKVELLVESLNSDEYVQIREMFIDQIKMDHVLLMISKVYSVHGEFDGTQLRGAGKIQITFDNPVWSWWCHHLRCIEVIENIGWRVRSCDE